MSAGDSTSDGGRAFLRADVCESPRPKTTRLPHEGAACLQGACGPAYLPTGLVHHEDGLQSVRYIYITHLNILYLVHLYDL